jgi:uncharacterized protein DUF4013
VATSTPPASRNIDIGRALMYVKDDPDWIRKLLIGALMVVASMFLIGVPFLLGYYQRTIKRTVDGEAYPLPDWDDWGGFFADGIKWFAVAFAHALILVAPMMCCMSESIVLMGAGGHHERHGGGPFAALGVVGMLAMYAFALIGGLLLAVYLPAAQIRLALTGNIGDAFQARANVAFIRRNVANYALSIVVMFIGNFVAQFAIILLCVGILPATVWAYTAFSYALGETVRRDPQFQATGTI